VVLGLALELAGPMGPACSWMEVEWWWLWSGAL